MTSGISAILGVISLLGFLMFLAGIGLVVVSASQGRAVRGGVGLAIFGLVLGLLFQLISQGVIVVEPTEVAVVFQTLTGELENPRSPGTHVVIPVLQQFQLYPTQRQEYTMSSTANEGQIRGDDDSVRARTSDGQEVRMDVTIIYRVDAAQVNILHVNWLQNYENGFVRPTVRGLTRDVASRFTAAQIFGQTRTEMVAAMEVEIGDRFAEEGLELVDLLLRDVTFSDQFTNAIEQAQVSEQEAIRAEIRVRQQQQEAERIRVQAAGQRDARIAQAEGEAQAIILQAQAEAEALRLVSEQIAANPSLIQYQYVQNLSDNVNIALVPSGSPFLFDFNALADPNTDFSAPETDFDFEAFQDSFQQPSGEASIDDGDLGALTDQLLGGDDAVPTETPDNNN